LEEKQNKLLLSLRAQPLIVVIRLDNNFFNISDKRKKLFLKIKNLADFGIKNIEIGWDSNPDWINLILDIKDNFQDINLGAASISSINALDTILPLNLNYSMSPLFNKEVHIEAIKNNQLLVPGVSNLKNFKEALNLGYKLIKIFPASKLGIEFLDKLKAFQEKRIFFIGAGGMKSKDLKVLLNNCYDTLVLGKELKDQIPDKHLKEWLKNL
tara:strand:- start:253 stop:888 length:636 start_codon:yes stop_codon:yes gene_type:complete